MSQKRTEAAKEHLLKALKSIRQGFGDGGICYQVRKFVAPEMPYSELALDAVCLLERTMLHWPKHSGDTLYPVPNPRKLLKGSPYGTFRYHCERGTLWDGAYGQKRKELLAWLIAEVEKE
jgi:hypothetical protein